MAQGKRNFKNFIESYFEYSRDSYCPDTFHYWTGLSLVAGAMERRCWVNYQGRVMYYPNLFIFLSGGPGLGKTTALNRGAELLRRLPDFSILPQQLSEAKLISSIQGAEKNFDLVRGGKTKTFTQSPAYYLAAEAKNSIKEVKGVLTSTFTDFYDCPDIWSKGTIARGTEELRGVCFNILAGSTITFLGELVGGSNILDGFASRVIYVMAPRSWERESRWERGEKEISTDTKEKLFEDLKQIYQLRGEFKADNEYVEAYDIWFRAFEKKRIETQSEIMQAMMIRQQTNLIKLSQILSAAEGNDMLMKKSHWDRALELITGVEKDLPSLIMAVQNTAEKKEDQGSVNQMLMRIVQAKGGKCDTSYVKKQAFMIHGLDPNKVISTLDALCNGADVFNREVRGTKDTVTLLVNPDNYL